MPFPNYALTSALTFHVHKYHVTRLTTSASSAHGVELMPKLTLLYSGNFSRAMGKVFCILYLG